MYDCDAHCSPGSVAPGSSRDFLLLLTEDIGQAAYETGLFGLHGFELPLV
jgi:hypothetical protein